MEVIKEDKNNIEKIVSSLKAGTVLVLATDTVYGLVCDAQNEKALEKIFYIKKRDRSKPLLTFVNSIYGVNEVALLNEKQKTFLKNIWPGQVTVIIKTDKKLSPLICKNGTVGVRVPKYPFLNLILEKFKKPLAQTSANVSGEGATTKINEIIEQFKNANVQPDIIVDSGDLPNREPSIIIDITEDKIKTLRE